MSTVVRTATGNSGAEDRFIELFCDAYGAEKGQYVYLQYPMVDIYGGHRTIDMKPLICSIGRTRPRT